MSIRIIYKPKELMKYCYTKGYVKDGEFNSYSEAMNHINAIDAKSEKLIYIYNNKDRGTWEIYR